MKRGDLVYFKKAKISPHSKVNGNEYVFTGHGFGVLMGEVPLGRMIRQEDVLALMGTVGYVRFDDVIEFLGAEIADTLITKFKAKYDVIQPEPEAPKTKIELVK